MLALLASVLGGLAAGMCALPPAVILSGGSEWISIPAAAACALGGGAAVSVSLARYHLREGWITTAARMWPSFVGVAGAALVCAGFLGTTLRLAELGVSGNARPLTALLSLAVIAVGSGSAALLSAVLLAARRRVKDGGRCRI